MPTIDPANITVKCFSQGLDDALAKLRDRVLETYNEQMALCRLSGQPNHQLPDRRTRCSRRSYEIHGGEVVHATMYAPIGLDGPCAPPVQSSMAESRSLEADGETKRASKRALVDLDAVLSVVDLDAPIETSEEFEKPDMAKRTTVDSNTCTVSFVMRDSWATYWSMLRTNEFNCFEVYSAAIEKIRAGRREHAQFDRSRSRLSKLSTRPLSFALFAGPVFPTRLPIIHPDSLLGRAWIIMAVVCILHDVILIPVLALFGDRNDSPFNHTMLLSMIFWTLDIVKNFRTGRYVHGVLEMQPWKIITLYVRSLFVLDFVLVVSDWSMLALSITVSERPFGPASVSIRILRIIRLARLIRLGKLLSLFHRVIGSQHHLNRLMVFSSVIKSLSMYAVYLHLLACAWYGIGIVSDAGWGTECERRSRVAVDCYVRAATWAMSSVHGAIIAEYNTSLEAVFATLSLFIGFLIFTWILGQFTSVMFHYKGRSRGSLRLRCTEYSKKYGLPSDLTRRLFRYIDKCDHGVDAGERLSRERAFVQLFPDLLQIAILQETRTPLITCVGIILDMTHVSSKIIQRLCCEATASVMALVGEAVFATGETAKSWRIVHFGSLLYITSMNDLEKDERPDYDGISAWFLGPSVTRKSYTFQEEALNALKGSRSYMSLENGSVIDHTKVLERGDDVSEMVLWIPWVHTGDLIAGSDSMVLEISYENFQQIIESRKDTCLMAGRYAHGYVQQMSNFDDGVCDLFKYVQQEGDENISFPSGGGHEVFLSHYKAEVGTEATLMQEGLKLLIARGSPHDSAGSTDSLVFLDSEDLTDLTSLKYHVGNSRCLVLLLSPGVLRRPWCLIEICTAMDTGVRIVPVEIQRHGMKFVYPDEDWFSKMRKGEILRQEDSVFLYREGITPQHLESSLRSVFKQIALPFSPHKSKGIREAELLDIWKRCRSGSWEAQSDPNIRWASAGSSVDPGASSPRSRIKP